MKRLTTLLIACAALLCGLSSCNLDKDYQFTYTYTTVVDIADEADEKAVNEYLNATFVDIKNPPTYFGKAGDALNHFIPLFVEDEKTVDTDFIYAHLKQEKDFVELVGIMRSSENEGWVGYHYWTGADRKTVE